MNTYLVDVCVVGAGPAGCSAAIMLSKLGLRVLLLERPVARRFPIGESLTPKIRILLEQLGVWPAFLDMPTIDFPGVVSVWGDANPSEHDYFGSVHNVGWHVDRALLDQMFLSEAQIPYHIPVLEVSAVDRLIDVKDQVHLECDSRRKQQAYGIQSRFVIDATGRRAAVARLFGANRKRNDRQIAIGTTIVEYGSGSDPRLMIEAVECGWWYTAPFPQGRRAIVFVTDTDLFPKSSKASVDYWNASLDGTILIRSVAPLASHPAHLFFTASSLSWLDRTSGANWLAVGDAAIAMDPLSGQGTYHGIRSGITAGKAAAEVLSGNETVLKHVQQETANHLQECLTTRNQLWARERRWPESPFWSRRQASE